MKSLYEPVAVRRRIAARLTGSHIPGKAIGTKICEGMNGFEKDGRQSAKSKYPDGIIPGKKPRAPAIGKIIIKEIKICKKDVEKKHCRSSFV